MSKTRFIEPPRRRGKAYIREKFKTLYIEHNGCLSKVSRDLKMSWLTMQRYEKKYFPMMAQAKAEKKKHKDTDTVKKVEEERAKFVSQEIRPVIPSPPVGCEDTYLNRIYKICYELVEQRRYLYAKAKPSGAEIAMLFKVGFDVKKTELELKKMDLEAKKMELDIEKLRHEMRSKALGVEEKEEQEVIVYGIPRLGEKQVS